ncbi:hypothetical protein SK571_40810 [Lentzea sp. BCCO 10_0798]|uniref:Uncharacterized protein n=1 Tax=Lentzea kristufekii TaxID=3095430 RepID=A0ABU4U6X8_9PSEU|nr:hypothetical protein [Lentzea sp. BCCO 10_0798]MDX8055756.1 hypothetical protein [Lentzea sp. BCCO 10_0798]
MDLSKSSKLGHFRHSVVMTGTCRNSSCRRLLKVPHSFDAPMGWIGTVTDSVTCHCGVKSPVRAHSG